ncbi:peptide-methionine (S)-S-oxide reductase MsrA [Puniceibacterium sediminis]|uniref:Peptide methionine sulfoxide reductase MsrA n=1 Tax=Puniceibacterium sediminis TaxID=1608407 RepID=A0A238VR85_9RHOB|nr:peptide-methionine (S)-S-oxide reductase MsrA [Puniceibacterium sediminis]SNR36835.1 peptide-methionine (S)-S-oxide reductase [Puniceibacterium sediminis]
MFHSSLWKPMLLALSIAIGLSLQSAKAHADEIVVAGGCFWCVEADFEKVKGVSDVVSGYTGGTLKNPTYKQVTKHGTGHYEAAKIIYDPAKVSLAQLYALYFRSVDPTDAGGQFCDRGDSYRTAIFVADAAQKAAAEQARADAARALGQKIVTPILAAAPFYDAEDYHQDYYKGSNRVVTRFGVIRQADAYHRYRKGCGRDARVKALWGADAAFVSG